MVKTLNPNLKKEKSSDKRKRRENSIKAREQAFRYVVPVIILIFALLAAFLVYRFGMGGFSPEERAKIRSQRKIAEMMRDYGTDFSKLNEMLGNKKGSDFGVPPQKPVENTFENSNEEAGDEAVVE